MYKTSIQILGALIILLSLSCSENYQGKYFQENNFNQYIQLEPDGKFLIKKSNGFEKGTYGIKNGAIALLTKEKVILGRIEKNKIILESGTLWRKK